MAYIMLMLVSMTLTLMQDDNGPAKAKKISVELSQQLSKKYTLNLLQRQAVLFKVPLPLKTFIYGLTSLFPSRLMDES